MQLLHFTYAEIAPHLCRNCVLGVQNLRTNKIYNLKYYARVTTTITTVIYLPFLSIKRVRARSIRDAVNIRSLSASLRFAGLACGCKAAARVILCVD